MLLNKKTAEAGCSSSPQWQKDIITVYFVSNSKLSSLKAAIVSV